MTMRADGRPYDPVVWLHEYQSPEVQTPDQPSYEDDAPLLSREQETRKKKSLDRRTQGDRQDWRFHLLPLPKGYRLAPEDTLTRPQKANRTRSIQKAEERRKSRRYVTRKGRSVFRDPVTEARHYGVELDPAKVVPWIDESVNREHYYPDEHRAGPYPHEEELDRLCDWFELTFTGDAERRFVEEKLTFKREVTTPRERAAWLYMGEWPGAIEAFERTLTATPGYHPIGG